MKTRGDERHGLRYAPEYKVWDGIIQRCTNPNSPNYKHYGAKGIEICPSWRTSFLNFYRDMGPRPKGKYSIERLRGAEGYSPDNCVWATDSQQNRNRMLPNNKTGTSGVSFSKQMQKYKVGMRVDGRQMHFGYFTDLADAVKARKDAEVKYGFFSGR